MVDDVLDLDSYTNKQEGVMFPSARTGKGIEEVEL